MPQISLTKSLWLLGLVAAIFLVELGSARLWDRDEPRNSRASHEMLQRGDWIVPTFNGQLRDHKPILLYWGQMACYQWFGESEFTARLPSALAAMLTVLVVAVLASRLSGKKTGINADGYWAAGALATCLLFVMAGRAATPDALLIAFSTLGIACLVVAALRSHAPYSSGRVGTARWLPAMVGYLALGLAALAKGPVGIVLPLAVVHLWWLICARLQDDSLESQPLAAGSWRATFGRVVFELWKVFHPWQCCRAIAALRVIPGMLVCLLAAAPWYIAVGLETDGAFLRGFFIEHNVSRAMHSMEGHDGSIFFYPLAFLVGTFPWSMWLIPIVMWARTTARECVVQRQLVVLAVSWIAVYVGAFSMASTKLPSYITPCYAGAALLVGGYWRHFESTWALPHLNWRRLAYGLTVVVGLAIATGLWVASTQTQMPDLAYAAVAGAAIAAMGCLGFVWEHRQQVRWVPATWLAGGAAFQLVLFGWAAPAVDSYRGDLALLKQADVAEPSPHWLSVGGLEPSWVHYLDRTIVEVSTDASAEETRRVVTQFLTRYPDGRIVVTDAFAHLLTPIEENSGGQFRWRSLAQGPRFLRSGQLQVLAAEVYPELTEGTVQAEVGLTTTLAGSVSDDDRPPREDSGPRVPAKTISHQRLLPDAGGMTPPNPVREPEGTPEDPERSGATLGSGNPVGGRSHADVGKDQPTNPLRPKRLSPNDRQ